MPSLAAASCQQAVNQTVSGVRVRSKIVPAVTDVRRPAAGALEPAVSQPPAALSAVRADEPRRPAQPLQVVQAVRIGGEPGQELPGRRRVVQAGHRARTMAGAYGVPPVRWIPQNDL